MRRQGYGALLLDLVENLIHRTMIIISRISLQPVNLVPIYRLLLILGQQSTISIIVIRSRL